MFKICLSKNNLNACLLWGSILILFLCLRIFTWKNTVLFEDLDSLGYLEMMKIIFRGDLEGLINLNPDYTPGYGILGAFFSLPGWGVEIGARLTSLFFSSLVFLALLGIGKHIARSWEIAFGLLLISFSPILISHSIAVLSEPAYIGLIYLGLWLFWGQYKDPVVGKAALLGIIFGFAFLTRTEGILYLLFIPLLQGVCTYWVGRNTRSLKHLISWSLVYILCFGALAAPQIWRVSEKMDTFAINGRQVWMAILNNPDGKSYLEKLKALDFSPSETNIQYLRVHPEKLPPSADLDLYLVAYKAFSNFTILSQTSLGKLLGPLCLIAFAFGLLSLYRSGYALEAFLILAFIAIGLVGPFMHNVDLRHILIIAPMMCLVAGIGIVFVSEELVRNYDRNSMVHYGLPVLFLFAVVATWALPLRNVFNPADYNRDYSPAELREPLRILNNIAENELRRAPIVLAQRSYIAYFLEGPRFDIPYTNYQGLVKYCELNEVEFIYFSHRQISHHKYPFFEDFTSGHALADLALVYTGVDAYGEKVELYRFRNSKT
jgi:hypothetical protein